MVDIKMKRYFRQLTFLAREISQPPTRHNFPPPHPLSLLPPTLNSKSQEALLLARRFLEVERADVTTFQSQKAANARSTGAQELPFMGR